MRVQLIIPDKAKHECVNYSMACSLEKFFRESEDVALTDTIPDIVHVFGFWNSHCSRFVSGEHSKKIPVVFTAIEGLPALMDGRMPLLLKLDIKAIVAHSAVVHVCGPHEERLLNGICPDCRLRRIANSDVTSLSTFTSQGEEMRSLYKEIIELHDNAVRAEIKETLDKENVKDDNIKRLCSKFMYVKYWFRRGGMPQSLIDDAASDLLASQYDESAMSDLLRRMGIIDFVSRLMFVMRAKSGLTEGFMPVPELEDKKAQEILNKTTDLKQ